MIIYTRRCLCRSNEKLKLNILKKTEPVEVRNINRSKIWREEAESYGLTLPFKVTDDGAKPL